MKSEMTKCEKCPHASRTLVGNDLWDFKCLLGESPKSCKRENDMKESTLEKLASSKQYVLEKADYGWAVYDNLHGFQAAIDTYAYDFRVYMKVQPEEGIYNLIEQIDLPALDDFRGFLDILLNLLRIKDWEEGEGGN